MAQRLTVEQITAYGEAKHLRVREWEENNRKGIRIEIRRQGWVYYDGRGNFVKYANHYTGSEYTQDFYSMEIEKWIKQQPVKA